MALRLEVKVVPGSSKSCCIIDKQQSLKCFLKAQAQDGKANQELIKIFAKNCNVRQRDVDIVAGLASRNKILLISTSMSYEQLLKIMRLEKQTKIF